MPYEKIGCPHNPAVGCYPHQKHCESCGWNPDVAKARLEAFCKKHGITLPEPKTEPEEE